MAEEDAAEEEEPEPEEVRARLGGGGLGVVDRRSTRNRAASNRRRYQGGADAYVSATPANPCAPPAWASSTSSEGVRPLESRTCWNTTAAGCRSDACLGAAGEEEAAAAAAAASVTAAAPNRNTHFGA